MLCFGEFFFNPYSLILRFWIIECKRYSYLCGSFVKVLSFHLFSNSFSVYPIVHVHHELCSLIWSVSTLRRFLGLHVYIERLSHGHVSFLSLNKAVAELSTENTVWLKLLSKHSKTEGEIKYLRLFLTIPVWCEVSLHRFLEHRQDECSPGSISKLFHHTTTLLSLYTARLALTNILPMKSLFEYLLYGFFKCFHVNKFIAGFLKDT